MGFAESANEPESSFDEVVSFQGWLAALERSNLPMQVRRDYRRDILGLLKTCKDARRPVSAGFIRWYLSRRGLTPGEREYEREALKWFFQSAKRAGGVKRREGGFVAPAADVASLEVQARVPGRGSPPPLAKDDLGASDWEVALIEAVRRRGLMWRTEQTYRDWARQFAGFLGDKPVRLAAGEEVQAFLSMLAVERRASAATQKQALNALAFLMQQALRVDLGDLEFRRARPRKKLPVVLSRDETMRLLAAVPEGYRLMAELMYGTGLRLMELLRLRVHHLDLARGQVAVYAGKGDKDRVTVLPEVLRGRLEAHLDRLREIFAEDRKMNRPGVWLP